ncbi:hypothetical protein NEUTE2DRAFT_62296 [Neurospora tetrasperma FGSC 2509]|nr:hypothetical protein NEUTE2DRAFT_62296 [Neurospora tetrasperma FGSC 2509]
MGRPFCSGVINHEDAILPDWGAYWNERKGIKSYDAVFRGSCGTTAHGKPGTGQLVYAM